MTDYQEIWCQPADQPKRQFLVLFDDPQMDLAVFDDEAEARSYWENATLNWTCYLLGSLPRNTKPLDLGITKEWFEKQAAKEGDLEIGAGRRTTSTINLTEPEILELEKLLLSSLPGWAREQIRRLTEALEHIGALEEVDAMQMSDPAIRGWAYSAANIARDATSPAHLDQHGQGGE